MPDNAAEKRSPAIGAPLLAIAALILALAFSAFLAQNSVRIEGKYTTDSIFYVDAARRIAEGGSAESGIATVREAVRDDVLPPQPLRMWAPGYPYAIAAAMRPGVTAPHAALIVTAWGIAGCILGSWLLGWALRGPIAAALAAALAVWLPALQGVAVHGWSEALAVAFLMIALALTVFAARAPLVVLAIAAGFAVAAALATRYALLPVAILPPLAVVLAHRNRRAIVFTVGYAASVAAAFAVVWLVSGWRPGGAGPEARPALDNPIPHLNALGLTLIQNLTPQSFFFALVIAVLIGCAIPGVEKIRRRQTPPAPALHRLGAGLVLGWCLLYAAALLYAELRYRLDPIEFRLAFPLVLPLVVWIASLLTGASRVSAVVPGAMALLLLASATHYQWFHLSFLRGKRPPPPHGVENRVNHSDLLGWLQTELEPDDIVMTIDALEVPFVLGPVRTLLWQSSADNPDAATLSGFLRRHRTEFGRLFIVLQRGMGSETGPESLPAPFAPGNEKAETAFTVVPARVCSDGAAYEVRLVDSGT